MPPQVFSAADAEQVHEATLRILDNPGVRIEHDALCARLLKAGARKGTGAQVIRFPRELVADAIARAPREILLGDRRGQGRAISAAAPAQVWSVPGMSILRGGRHRPFTARDMADFARLLDQLPRVDGVFGVAMNDVPPARRDVTGLRIMADNTRKHIRVLCFTPAGAEALCRMKPVLGDGAWFSVGFTAHGPLRWTHLALEIFARTAGHGIPATLNGEPMAGASGPVTLAGSAVVGNAEILSGLVVNQLLEPGRPCIYNLGLAHVFDMRTAIAVTGGPENHLLAAVSAAMGRFYNLPSGSWVSSESMCPDAQAALEKGIGFLTHLQSGVSLIWGVGQVESELTLSPAQAVIDNETLGYAGRYLRGVETTADTLAEEVIRSVGIAGNYLSEEHTSSHMRTELFEPALLYRRRRSDWTAGGSPTLGQAAEARADELIAADRPAVLTEEQRRALVEIEESVG